MKIYSADVWAFYKLVPTNESFTFRGDMHKKYELNSEEATPKTSKMPYILLILWISRVRLILEDENTLLANVLWTFK